MTSFTGPIRGKLANSETFGVAEMTRRMTVAAINSAANPAETILPTGCDITDVLIDVETPFAAGALATAAQVQIQLASAGNLIRTINVSASGRYDAIDDGTGGLVSRLRNVTETTVQAFVSAASLATSMTVGQAIMTVRYRDNG